MLWSLLGWLRQDCFSYLSIFRRDKQMQPLSTSPNFYTDMKKPYYSKNNSYKSIPVNLLMQPYLCCSNINQFVYLKLFFYFSKLELSVRKVMTFCLVNDWCIHLTFILKGCSAHKVYASPTSSHRQQCINPQKICAAALALAIQASYYL